MLQSIQDGFNILPVQLSILRGNVSVSDLSYLNKCEKKQHPGASLLVFTSIIKGEEKQSSQK